MAITDVNGVVTEGRFEDKDEFERCGVVRSDVFAVCDRTDKLKQIKFNTASLAAGGSATLTATADGGFAPKHLAITSVAAAVIPLEITGEENGQSSSFFKVNQPVGNEVLFEIDTAGLTQINNGNIVGQLTASNITMQNTGLIRLKSYTVVEAGSPSGAGDIIYVSDETGGPTLAFSDGTNWRRVQDRAIIS